MPRHYTIAALTLLVAPSLFSQSPAASTAADSMRSTRSAGSNASRRTIVSVNPLAAFALHFTGDIEHRVSRAVSVGIGATASEIEDYNNYRALDFKVRYYPMERVLNGFSVGASVGFGTTNGSERFSFVTANGIITYFTESGASTTKPPRIFRPLIGSELSYQWLLGPSRRFVAVTAIGVKRRLGSEGPVDPLSIPLLPTARLNIGFAY
jgi:hypothetical protein